MSNFLMDYILFQPYRETRDILFECKDKDIVSPLFTVINGKLVDPIALAHKIGVSKFLNTYVKGKTFNVFAGSEMIGTIVISASKQSIPAIQENLFQT